MENPTNTRAQIQLPTPSLITPYPDSDSGSDLVTLPFLPLEVITEILLKLPVKSLCIFKCVSRSWLSIISSSLFIKSHLNFNFSTDNRKVLILGNVFWMYYLKLCSLTSLLSENGSDEHGSYVDYAPFEEPLRYILVVGCCDGLICTATAGFHVFLWNPSTRKFKELPNLWNTLKSMGIEYGNFSWGFGYDEVGDDYKVVAVVGILHFHGGCTNKVFIYSRKTECWRRIEDIQDVFLLEESGKFVNGKLHWLLAREKGEYIFSFDLATEAYEWVEKPNFDKGYDHHDSKLYNFQGSLCLVVDQHGDHVDVWIMNEYGVKGSWIKTLTIPLSLGPWNVRVRPLCISDKGKVLLILGTKLILYNPNDISNVDMEYGYQLYDAFLFTESLVSPHVTYNDVWE